jgi:hypothetical protein
MLRILAVCCIALGPGCISTSDFLAVRMRNLEAVEVQDSRGRPAEVERTGDDIRVGDASLLGGHPRVGRPVRTLVQPLARRPDKLPTRDGRFVWRAQGLTASTPLDNVESAEIATTWTQWHGELPSLAAIVLGGMGALGWGLAGGVTLAEAYSTSPPDQEDVNRGILLSSLGAASLGLVTYGVVTWLIVKQGTTWAELDVR